MTVSTAVTSQPQNITIENARIIFRNFAGKEEMYNAEGNRNFSIVLEEDVAKYMTEQGWNVKYLKAREEGEEPTPYIQVTVSFKVRPPRVVMITSKGKTGIPEDLVEILDWADMETVDVILNPYTWSVNGKTGIKAYLKSIFVTIREDELELKYADVKEIGAAEAALQIEADDILEGEIIDAEDV